MNSACALLDGTALVSADEYGSHFNNIFVFGLFGTTIAPFIAGAAIEDPDEDAGKG